jgi:ribonuclease VapC
MIVDSSAIMAILLKEAESDRILDVLENSNTRLISSAPLLETYSVVLNRAGAEGLESLHQLLANLNLEEEPFTIEQRKIAQRACFFYGRGRHKASLNFGDCMVYALAKDMNEPLLCKGDDFAKTDIALVQY